MLEALQKQEGMGFPYFTKNSYVCGVCPVCKYPKGCEPCPNCENREERKIMQEDDLDAWFMSLSYGGKVVIFENAVGKPKDGDGT